MAVTFHMLGTWFIPHISVSKLAPHVISSDMYTVADLLFVIDSFTKFKLAIIFSDRI